MAQGSLQLSKILGVRVSVGNADAVAVAPVVLGAGEEDQGVVEAPAERGVVGAGHPEVPLPERVGLVARLLQLLRDACARQQ